MQPASGGFWTAQVVDFSLGQVAEIDLSHLTELPCTMETEKSKSSTKFMGILFMVVEGCTMLHLIEHLLTSQRILKRPGQILKT
jgi:hypothetical protein